MPDLKKRAKTPKTAKQIKAEKAEQEEAKQKTAAVKPKTQKAGKGKPANKEA